MSRFSAAVTRVRARSVPPLERALATYLAAEGRRTARTGSFDSVRFGRGLRRILARHDTAVLDRVVPLVSAATGTDAAPDATAQRRYLRAAGRYWPEITAYTRRMASQAIEAGEPVGALHVFSPARAALVARSETYRAVNLSTTAALAVAGVTHVRVTDGTTYDDACRAANGSTWTLARAEAEPLQHPRCTRSFSPAPRRAA